MRWICAIGLALSFWIADGRSGAHAAEQPADADAGLRLPIVPRGFGVNIHFTDPVPGEMARFAEAHFGLARMDFHWARVERTPGVYDFAPYDRLLEHLSRARARPLFILDYGHPRHDGGQAPHSEAARAAFARFAAAAAAHYRGRGVLWEIWNEPNLKQFWKPEPDAAAYAALALGTARAIRTADPNAAILAPGSSGFPWEFFETAFRAGLLEVIDAVSVHPYRGGPPESVAADYGRLRALIARYAPASRRDLPIVSSEWGYSTAEGGVSEAQQAQYLARTWLTNLACGVNASIFYDWRDDGDDPKEREHRFGTVRRDFTPKPSFNAAKALIAALEGYSFRHRLAGSGDASDWQLLFQRGDSNELARVSWSAAPNAPEAVRTPVVHRLDRSDPEFAALRRLASIRYAARTRAEGSGAGVSLALTLSNPESDTARISVAESDRKGTLLDISLTRGAHEKRTVTLELPRLRSPRRSVPLRLTWNGQTLPAVAPLDVWRTDPITLSAAPRDRELEVRIEGLGGRAWSGRAIVTSEGREVGSAAVTLPETAQSTTLRLPMPNGWHVVALVDRDGAEVARSGRRRYQQAQGFPTKPAAESGFASVLFVENHPRPAEPVAAVAVPAGSPAPAALAFRYHFDAGWRYAQVKAEPLGPIPAHARALTLWIRGDREKDLLRARFRDATGQTFQVDLGTTEGTDWRPVTIALDGSSAGGHWGGANDGVPHPPLSWDGLVLIDSARRDAPHDGAVLLAAPRYVFGQ